jgi:Ulp1 family protease
MSIVGNDGSCMTLGDLLNLEEGRMVHDEIVNFCTQHLMALIPSESKILCLNTWIHPLLAKLQEEEEEEEEEEKKDTKEYKKKSNKDRLKKVMKRDVMGMWRYLFIPIHGYLHWKLLILEQRTSKLFLLDSIQSTSGSEDERFFFIFFVFFVIN